MPWAETIVGKLEVGLASSMRRHWVYKVRLDGEERAEEVDTCTEVNKFNNFPDFQTIATLVS